MSPGGALHARQVLCACTDGDGGPGGGYQHILAGGDVQQRHPTHPPKELSNLPPARPSRADVVPHVSEHAPLGEGDEGCGGGTEDAAVVRRSAGRPLLERPLA